MRFSIVAHEAFIDWDENSFAAEQKGIMYTVNLGKFAAAIVSRSLSLLLFVSFTAAAFHFIVSLCGKLAKQT